MKPFLDSVGGGAWPFLVGGVICLVNSDNERDSSLLIRLCRPLLADTALPRGTDGVFSRMRKSNNRSVMPLDVRGRTRATLKRSACMCILLRKERETE